MRWFVVMRFQQWGDQEIKGMPFKMARRMESGSVGFLEVFDNREDAEREAGDRFGIVLVGEEVSGD